jgi:membrane glycosyltransferase
VLGVLLGGAAWAISLSLALWMLPVVLGLALAIPLAIITGQRRAGQALRRLGLLRIPEEIVPPNVLARTGDLAHAADADATVTRLFHDPALLAAHRAMLPPPRRPRVDPIDAALLVGREKLAEALSFETAWSALTHAERLAVLSDDPCLVRLAALSARDG